MQALLQNKHFCWMFHELLGKSVFTQFGDT